MPRAKRKAKNQSQPGADFSKKKVKLGKKTRADNYTDTSVKSKQLQIPSQIKPNQQQVPTSTKHLTGLSFRDLISRCKHHNSSTRISALNALTNALQNTQSVAHIQCNQNVHLLIHTSTKLLADEIVNVRTAATNLLVQVVKQNQHDIKTLITSIEMGLLSVLSHLRNDIRIDAAKTLCFVAQLLPKGMLFIQAGSLHTATHSNLDSLLCALTHMLQDRPVSIYTLSAIYIVCEPLKESNPSAKFVLKTKNDKLNEPFYYYKRNLTKLQSLQNLHMIKFPSQFLPRLTDIILESLPCAKQDRNCGIQLDIAMAIITITVHNETEEKNKYLHRIIEGCLSNKNQDGLSIQVTISLVKILFAFERFKQGIKLILELLEEGKGNNKTNKMIDKNGMKLGSCWNINDIVYEMLMTKKIEMKMKIEICVEWIRCYKQSIRSQDIDRIVEGMYLYEMICEMDNFDDKYLLLNCIPMLMKIFVKWDMKNMNTKLLRILKNLYWFGIEKQSESEIGHFEKEMEKILNGICEDDIINGLEECGVKEVMSFGYNSKQLSKDVMVKMIRRKIDRNQWDVVEAYVEGLESMMMTEDENEIANVIAICRVLFERVSSKREDSEKMKDMRRQMEKIMSMKLNV